MRFCVSQQRLLPSGKLFSGRLMILGSRDPDWGLALMVLQNVVAQLTGISSPVIFIRQAISTPTA